MLTNQLPLWLKYLHLIGVILFLGNIIVTAWWKIRADRTKNPQIIAFAQRQVTLTDWLFTAGGAALLLIAGVGSVALNAIPHDARWLHLGGGLFVLSGLIWISALIPTQMKQAKLARSFANDNHVPDAYWALCKRWNFWGACGVIVPMLALYCMVFKI